MKLHSHSRAQRGNRKRGRETAMEKNHFDKSIFHIVKIAWRNENFTFGVIKCESRDDEFKFQLIECAHTHLKFGLCNHLLWASFESHAENYAIHKCIIVRRIHFAQAERKIPKFFLQGEWFFVHFNVCEFAKQCPFEWISLNVRRAKKYHFANSIQLITVFSSISQTQYEILVITIKFCATLAPSDGTLASFNWRCNWIQIILEVKQHAIKFIDQKIRCSGAEQFCAEFGKSLCRKNKAISHPFTCSAVWWDSIMMNLTRIQKSSLVQWIRLASKIKLTGFYWQLNWQCIDCTIWTLWILITHYYWMRSKWMLIASLIIFSSIPSDEKIALLIKIC